MSKKEIKIQIIGAGVVGKAFGKALRDLGYRVYQKDLNFGHFDKKADIFFICTQEKHVFLVLQEYFPQDFDRPIVIRSTMPPDLFTDLKTAFPHLHLSTNPEFLRQAKAEEDSKFPEFHVIGQCCEKHGKFLKGILEDFKCPIAVTDPQTALMIKLAHNCFLTTLISYWNEIAKISPGVDKEFVGKICSFSKRIPTYGTRVVGSPFEGPCLPKDLRHLIEYAKRQGIDPVLLKAVLNINDELVKKGVKPKI